MYVPRLCWLWNPRAPFRKLLRLPPRICPAVSSPIRFEHAARLLCRRRRRPSLHSSRLPSVLGNHEFFPIMLDILVLVGWWDGGLSSGRVSTPARNPSFQAWFYKVSTRFRNMATTSRSSLMVGSSSLSAFGSNPREEDGNHDGAAGERGVCWVDEAPGSSAAGEPSISFSASSAFLNSLYNFAKIGMVGRVRTVLEKTQAPTQGSCFLH